MTQPPFPQQPPGLQPPQGGPAGQQPPDYGAPPVYGAAPGYGQQVAPQGMPPQGMAHGIPPQGVPPQQYWGHPAPSPVAPPGPHLGTHLRRAFDWDLSDVTITAREQQVLAQAGVQPRLQGLFAWRRSTLLVAVPVLVLAVILSFVEAAQNDTSGYNGFGKLWNYLPSIGLLFAPIGAVRVISGWTELRRSSRFLIVCWVLSLAFPLAAALVPLDLIIDIGGQREQLAGQGGDVAAFDTTVFLARLIQAVNFALILLPVVLSVPGGVLKGAARIKSLFPSSSLPGWFLVVVAPFYSMFTIVVFVLIDQIIGNVVLLLGVGVLAFTPWLFVIYRNVYGRPLSQAEARTELARATRLGGVLLALAIALIVIFLVTAKVNSIPVLGTDENAVFSYVQVFRTVGEVISRGLLTTVVFSTIFLSMVFGEWRASSLMTAEIKREHDEQMSALGSYFADHQPLA